MNINTHISIRIPAFHGRELPEEGVIVGYAALISYLELPVPIPEIITLISDKNKKYEIEGWKVFTPKHKPEESIYKQLVFALKYEGVHLLVFKKIFKKLTTEGVLEILRIEPTGIYSRKIWFLYEWLMNETLDIPDLTIKKAIPLIDEKLQFAIPGISSPRHRIINNLPGTISYCPLIRKSEKLENYISENYSEKKQAYLSGLRKDVLQRASAFLLLKDSKASFTIEGESPKSKRAARWGQAIGQAGTKNLSKEEFIRLQQTVIENDRFIEMGFREKGGFIGEHDRSTGAPLPDHISAKWEDLEQLVSGLLTTNEKLLNSNLDAVLTATVIAFGFVFIHPFEDGNGRIHRYLIHHVLAKKKFSQQGMIFPVSSSILDHIADYRSVLEAYSRPLLDFIEWEETEDHNVKVFNETLDYYRYFDATKQAEFLYDCVHDTIENIIPDEISYLTNYDEFKRYIDDEFEMPDKLVALLVRFLDQNEGKLSKRAREKEFASLKDSELNVIQNKYIEIFQNKK
jgi:Fic family protein